MRAILALVSVLGTAVLGSTVYLRPLSAQEQAKELTETDRQQVQDVIRKQLDAFKHDDGQTAFGFASPGIQGMFGDAQNFMGMVKNSYPQVYRPQDVEFRDLVDLNGRPTQRVLLVGPDGKPVIALYAMERQPDGTWKIDGCMLAKSNEVTA